MNDSDKKRFAELMAVAAEATSHQVSDATYKTYWQLLNSITIEEFECGITSHLLDTTEGMFFPKPANILKQINGTEKQNQMALDGSAELAWQSVVGEISRIGSYGSPKIDDGLALAAIKSMGGWPELCRATVDKMTWLKKDFVSSYVNYSNTPIDMLPKSLPGRIQIENSRKKGSASGAKSLANIIGSARDKISNTNQK